MKIKSRETYYEGILYRSRLEATWAAFFDLCGWSHRYEPMDLDGWTPDFELSVKRGRRMLVEVKPYNFEVDGYETDKFFKSYRKAINHSKDFDILLLGISTFIESDFDCPAIGFMYEDIGEESPDIVSSFANFKTSFNTNKHDRLHGFSSMMFLWDDRMGEVTRKQFDDDFQDALRLFNMAITETRKYY